MLFNPLNIPLKWYMFVSSFQIGKQKLGEIGQLAPDLTAETVAIEMRFELSPLSLTVYLQLPDAPSRPALCQALRIQKWENIPLPSRGEANIMLIITQITGDYECNRYHKIKV